MSLRDKIKAQDGAGVPAADLFGSMECTQSHWLASWQYGDLTPMLVPDSKEEPRGPTNSHQWLKRDRQDSYRNREMSLYS